VHWNHLQRYNFLQKKNWGGGGGGAPPPPPKKKSPRNEGNWDVTLMSILRGLARPFGQLLTGRSATLAQIENLKNLCVFWKCFVCQDIFQMICTPFLTPIEIEKQNFFSVTENI